MTIVQASTQLVLNKLFSSESEAKEFLKSMSENKLRCLLNKLNSMTNKKISTGDLII